MSEHTFPMEMKQSDGSTIVINSVEELQKQYREIKKENNKTYKPTKDAVNQLIIGFRKEWHKQNAAERKAAYKQLGKELEQYFDVVKE